MQRCMHAKQRRQQLTKRRRPQLQDVVQHTAAPGLREAAGVHDDAKSSLGNMRCEVRDRLRARLVERRATELVAALVRRHGDAWSSHVLQGSFHADEAMRRICEAFGLRPDLECQVLRKAIERAKLSTKTGADFDKPQEPTSPASTASSVMSEGISDRGAKVGLQTCPCASSREDTRRADSDCGESMSSVSSFCRASSPGSMSDPSANSSGGESLDDSENEDAESLGWTLEDSVGCHAMENGQHSRSFGQGGTPQLWKTSWKMRVLHTLGLDRLWPALGSVPLRSVPQQDVVTSATDLEPALSEILRQKLEEAQLSDLEHKDDEDAALSSKLVAAVMNAERHAAESQVANGTVNLEDTFEAKPRIPLSRRCQHQSEVQFGDDSQVCFFEPGWGLSDPEESASRHYCRTLQTKVFDGPSAHKARREKNSEESDWLSDSEDEDDEGETFDDRCDEIADLMSQQRHMLLWSGSW